MAKSKQIYVCSECGSEYGQWFGYCKDCDAYGTISEEPIELNSSGSNRSGWQSNGKGNSKTSKTASPEFL